MTISLSFKDATKPLEFYQKAFGAEQRALVIGPGGQGVIHSELRIGDTILILADDIGMTGKTVDEGYAAAFVPHLWVTDADATWKRALDAGRKEHMPLAMQFWATATAKSSIPSACAGPSPRTWRTSPMRR